MRAELVQNVVLALESTRKADALATAKVLSERLPENWRQNSFAASYLLDGEDDDEDGSILLQYEDGLPPEDDDTLAEESTFSEESSLDAAGSAFSPLSRSASSERGARSAAGTSAVVPVLNIPTTQGPGA